MHSKLNLFAGIFSFVLVFIYSDNAYAQTGACCIPIDGSCQDLNETDCDNEPGYWQGDTTSCGAFTCPPALGAGLLVDQTFNCTFGIACQQFPDFGDSTLDAADDFVVPANQIFDITEVTVSGSFSFLGPIDSVDVIIYADDGTLLPGATTCVYPGEIPTGGTSDPNFVIPLTPACQLLPGTYWIEVRPTMPFNGGDPGQWFWNQTTIFYGEEYRWQDPDSLISGACPTWVPQSACIASVGQSLCFSLAGTSEDDADGDGIGDSSDICDGFDDSLDDDSDGVPNGCDICEGFDDSVDSDLDGTPDGCDECPDDAAKTEQGVCGCGVADEDADANGLLDCLDQCPDDPNKDLPGLCGCGVPDTDENGNSLLDCTLNDQLDVLLDEELELLSSIKRRSSIRTVKRARKGIRDIIAFVTLNAASLNLTDASADLNLILRTLRKRLRRLAFRHAQKENINRAKSRFENTINEFKALIGAT